MDPTRLPSVEKSSLTRMVDEGGGGGKGTGDGGGRLGGGGVDGGGDAQL
jgi:hypothetical protein